MVEAVDGPQEAEVALLNQILQRQQATVVLSRDGDDEPQVGTDEGVLGDLEGPVAAPHLGGEAHVARVDIELSPAGDPEPLPLRRAELTPAHPYRWLTLPAEEFGPDGLRWRPVLYESASDQFVVGPWQVEGALAAVVTLGHVYPRTPIRIRARADLAALPEVRAVLLQIKSGRVEADAASDLTCTLTAGDTRELVVWPDSIFERGFSFRYAIEIADAGWVWTDWRYSTEPEIIMPVADDFYRTRIVHLALTAPWSLRNGPDPSSVDAELIFAEVSARSAAQDASFTFTFDRSNSGTEPAWKFRARKGADLVLFEILALTVDGRMLTFGPFESDQERVAFAISTARISDTEPAEFAVRMTSP
ncbi:hypothetical protein OV203_21750 [Nannocystis sp. ILAH1]|uniref:hypothetical protein n=1 Tax=Nannocystis sp. ILAH1 TaxID=2996789 RepID=UPI00226ED0F8|nr:hypothetical protein [Nannocystis sp. ILAH1]MCY0989777.1 hypothetical protein [Nannocystis sp. ILAH1]